MQIKHTLVVSERIMYRKEIKLNKTFVSFPRSFLILMSLTEGKFEFVLHMFVQSFLTCK